jgi:heavy metal sensor kinase
MNPLSIRARLTLYYALALAVITLLLSTGVYFLVRADLLRQMDSQLAQDLSTVSNSARREPDEVREVAEEGSITLFEVRGTAQPIATPGWQRAGLDNAELKESGPMLEGETARHRLYYLKRGTVRSGHLTLQVLVARDGESVRHTLRSLAAVLAVGFACALGLALVGGYFMAGRVLAPIGAMASKAQAITADKLAERLPVHNPDDELGRLATTFNSTLARLQDSFDRLTRFTSDASHELRTPLTVMKSVGEVSLRQKNDPSAYREGIGSMLEEVDRMTRLVESLLTLTRGDSGVAKLSRLSTDLSALTVEVMECVHVLADEKGIALSADAADQILVTVDPAVLRQAVVNLLDNAIKYTPEGGEVRVAVRQSNGRATIEVSDTGPGIPAQHRNRVFDRFHRGDAARSSETGGVGLGLAIAKWAVEANGGAIELVNQNGAGSVFRITLPNG